MPAFRLRPGLRVLVTAGASGIGRSIADLLILNGARVHVCDVSEDHLAGFRAAYADHGTSLCDVSRDDDSLWDGPGPARDQQCGAGEARPADRRRPRPRCRDPRRRPRDPGAAGRRQREFLRRRKACCVGAARIDRSVPRGRCTGILRAGLFAPSGCALAALKLPRSTPVASPTLHRDDA